MSYLNTCQNGKFGNGVRIQGKNFTWERLSFPLESVTEFPLTFKGSKSKSAQKKHKQKHPKPAETSLHNFKNMKDKSRHLNDIYMCYAPLISDEK